MYGVEGRADIGFQDGKAFVPQHISYACTHNSHIDKGNETGGIVKQDRKNVCLCEGTFNHCNRQITQCSNACCQPCDKERMVLCRDFPNKDGYKRPNHNRKKGEQDSAELCICDISSQNDINTGNCTYDSCNFAAGDVLMEKKHPEQCHSYRIHGIIV